MIPGLLLQALALMVAGGLSSHCSGASNTWSCLAEREQATLEQFSRIATRDQGDLTIETRQGIRHFVNSLDHSFVLFSCDSTLAWCTVVEGANEWLQILTVSLDDGRIHRTIDVPLPSPGGEYVAVGSPPDLYVEGFVEIRESVNFTVLDQWDSSKLRAFCGKDLFGGIPFVGATNMSWESVDRMRLEIQCGEQSVDARIQRSATGDWMLFTKEPSQLPPPN